MSLIAIRCSILSFFLCWSFHVHSQVLTDGPLDITVRLKSVYVGFSETDVPILGASYAPDEIKFRVWVVDNANISGLNWQGGKLYEYEMGTGSNLTLPGTTHYIGDTLFHFNYSTDTVPEFISIKLEAWEDDLPSDPLIGNCMSGNFSIYDTTRCCGNLLFGTCVGMQEGDDKYCNNPIFAEKVAYRTATPGTLFNMSDISGNCGNNWRVNLEVYWNSPNVSTLTDINSVSAVNIYPNPTLSTWNVNVGDEWLGATIGVFDIHGKCVYHSKVVQQHTELFCSATNGYYILQLTSTTNESKRIQLVHW